MIRSRMVSTAQRAFSMIARGTLVKADDSKKWQEVTIRSEAKRKFTNVEAVHPYGFTAVPLPPKDDTGSEAAEAIVVYLDGDMSHPVVLAIGDRRYRLKGLKDGEAAIYDDLGQKVHITRDGIRVDAGTAQKVIKVTCGQSEMVIAKDHMQMKKPGDTSLHITLDIANAQLVAGKAWVIAPDPYPQD